MTYDQAQTKLAEENDKALKAYAKVALASKEAARAALVKLGTHTKAGNLTKRYK